MIANDSHGEMRRNYKDAGRACPVDYHLSGAIFILHGCKGIKPTWIGITDEEIAAREKERLEADPNLESVVAAIARQQAVVRGIEVEAHPGVDGPTGA